MGRRVCGRVHCSGRQKRSGIQFCETLHVRVDAIATKPRAPALGSLNREVIYGVNHLSGGIWLR